MILTETHIPGAYIIDIERLEDERGFFARTFDLQEFEKYNLNPRLVQSSVSFNFLEGTLRGMHYQAPPHAEAKLVRCTMGAIYDVLLDVRPNSPHFGKWVGVELTAENRRMVYIPEGVAHGFQTLTDDTEVFYQMSAVYVLNAARGVRWNDPMFSIDWPLPVTVMSDKDRSLADFR